MAKCIKPKVMPDSDMGDAGKKAFNNNSFQGNADTDVST